MNDPASVEEWCLSGHTCRSEWGRNRVWLQVVCETAESGLANEGLKSRVVLGAA